MLEFDLGENKQERLTNAVCGFLVKWCDGTLGGFFQMCIAKKNPTEEKAATVKTHNPISKNTLFN